MARVETFGDCRIILGECLDPEVADLIGPVDGWVGDPPYDFRNSGGGKFRKARRKGSDAIVRLGLDQGFDHAALALGAARSLVVFCHNDQLESLLAALRHRFDRRVVLTWGKTNAPPWANKNYQADLEFYIHAWNKGAHPIGSLADKSRRWDGRRDWDLGFEHPTIKPLALMCKIVRNMNARVILDPFMGTGTTGEACLIERRGFVGVEKDPVFFDMACRRLESRMAWLREWDAALGEAVA